MHEIGLIAEAITIATDAARKSGADRIVRLHMKVGPLSGAVPEALEFAFDMASRGTIAEGAALEIERVPIVCFCFTCSQEYSPPDLLCECTLCGRTSADVRHGRELQLTSLEVC